MKFHFLDDDYSTNRYHQITLSPEAEALSSSIAFFDRPLDLLQHYEEQNDLPDILFLDINMPVIDGWQFLEKYNNKFPTVKTKTIILTTSNDPKILEMSRTYPNIKGVMIKPLSSANFREMVTEYADQ